MSPAQTAKRTLTLIAKLAAKGVRARTSRDQERHIATIGAMCRIHQKQRAPKPERLFYTACGSPSDPKTTAALDNVARAVAKAVQRGEIKVSDYKPSRAVQKRLDAFRSRPGNLDSMDIRYGGDETSMDPALKGEACER